MSDLDITEGPILSEISDCVAHVTINRAHRKNALDHTAVEALSGLLDRLASSEVSVIVLSGQGGSAFCAGDDIKAYSERDVEASRAHFRKGLALMDQFADHPCFVIAAIEGYCIGGGLELAIACDHRIATRDAVFSLPEVRKLGGCPTWGGLTRMPGLLGLSRAKRIVLLGEVWNGEEAQAEGLVDAAVNPGTAVGEAMSLAEAFSKDVKKPVLARSKRIMNQATAAQASAQHALNLTCEEIAPFDGDIG